MPGPFSRQHAGPAHGRPAIPEPSYAERARTLVQMGRTGSLSTFSRKQPGFPFGSVMPYSPDRHGCPVLLISSMAMHTQNLQADARASLLVMQPNVAEDPLGAARVTLLGEAAPVPAEETAALREPYLSRHENARHWVDFDDFAFYRISVIDVYFVGGFGVMGWVSAADYQTAEPDPLAEASAGILQHMNADHAGALVLLARAFSGIEARRAAMTSVDRLGFHLRLETGDRVQGVRIAFLREVRTPQDARAVLVEMVRAARA